MRGNPGPGAPIHWWVGHGPPACVLAHYAASLSEGPSLIAIVATGGARAGTPLLFLCGLLGCALLKGLLPLFAFLLMLTLLVVNTLDKGVH